RSRGRPGDLPEDVAHELRDEGEDADPHPARRERPARPHPERLRAAAGPGGPRRAGADGRVQGLRPRHQQAQADAPGHAAQPRLVRAFHRGGSAAGLGRPRAMRRGVIVVLLSAVLAASSPASGGDLSAIKARGTLRALMTNEDYPEWFSLKGGPDAGFEREL